MKKMLALFIFTAAASCMNAGCGSSNNYQGNMNQGRYQGQNYQYQGQGNYQNNGQRQFNRYSQDQNQVDDQKLTTDIQNHLKDNDKYSNVKATVSSGYVTLVGTVQTQEDKNALEKKVRETKGVQGINSQVTVQSQSNYQNRNY